MNCVQRKNKTKYAMMYKNTIIDTCTIYRESYWLGWMVGEDGGT